MATLFCLRAKFEKKISLWVSLFKVASYDKVTTSAKPEKNGLFDAFIDSF